MKRELFIIVILMIIFMVVKDFLWNSKYNDYKKQVFNIENYSSIDSIFSNFDLIIDEVDHGSNSEIFLTTTILTLINSTNHITKIPQVNNVTNIQENSQPRKIEQRKEFQKISSDLKFIKNKSNVHIVETHSNATFLERIEDFCTTISKERQRIISTRGLKTWQDVQRPEKLKVLWGRDDNFLIKLTSEENFRFVILPWKINSSQEDANVVIRDYYRWTASNLLCQWIRTPRFTKGHFDAVYNRSCEENPEISKLPTPLEPLYFYGRPINRLHYWPNDGLSYPSHFYTRYPSAPLYLTIVQDGIVNIVGDVISGDTKIVPYTCSHDNLPTIPMEYMESPIYKEVFVITQFWGDAFFHRLIEVMPRLAPYLSFLKKHTTIKIHAPTDKGMAQEMMTMLGLNPERIVVGVLRAKIVYLPQGTPCGFPNVQSLQLLSHHFRTFLNEKTNHPNVTKIRNKLVMIKRSGTRRLLHDRETEFLLRNLSSKYDLDFHLFSDNSLPGLLETMRIFSTALVVVAPHGAGLSNVIFSEPGTLVVEGVCNPPHVNMCFQFVAHVLGHRYHGLPSLSGCESFINIVPQNFVDVIEQFFSAEVASLPKS